MDRSRETRFLKRNLEKALKIHVLQKKTPAAKRIGNGILDRDVIMEDIEQKKTSDQGLEISREKRTMLTPARSISPSADNVLAKQRPLDKFMEKVKPSWRDEILPAHILKIEVISLKRKGQEPEEHSRIIPQPPSKWLKSKLTVCHCELKIYGQGPCDKSLKLMVQDTQICSFSRALGGPEDTIVEIDLVEGAFYVKADRLLGESQKGTRRIQTLLDSYRIVISFTPIGSAGWPLLEDEYTSRHLVSVYDGLPGSSPDGSLLDVEVASAVGGMSVPCAHFSLELKTLWSAPPPWPQELLRPKLSSDVREISPSVPQIKCLSFPSNAPYENGATKRRKLRRYNDEDGDENTVNWVRPSRPFTESRITGKDSLPTSPPAPVQPSGSSLSASNPHSRKAPGEPTVVDPDAIPDLPPRNPKKVPVPPGGRYFRTLSKRRLKAGEMLSDSDDEVDESWLVQKHNETLDDFADVFAAEKVFAKGFDEHMLREDLSGHCYVPHSLVRFCRANRALLNTPDMIVEFWKQTLYLVQHGVINAAHVKVCMDIIGGTGEGQRSRVKLGSSIPRIAEESHDDSPLARRSTVTTVTSGDYINTELCFGGCGPWTRSNIIVCLDRMCGKPSGIFLASG